VEPIVTLSERLRAKIPAIAQRWLGDALAAYPADSAAVFRREKDPFANPVGHALRVGTRAVVEAILEGDDPEEIASHLDEVVKIRAVQEFMPSEALAFVFLLKDAIRAELGGGGPAGVPPSELADIERRIDLLALAVFDIYTRYRGRLCELRINEVKRNVWRLGSCEHAAAQRGDAR